MLYKRLYNRKTFGSVVLLFIVALFILFQGGTESDEQSKKVTPPKQQALKKENLSNQIVKAAADREKKQLHEIGADGIDDTVTAVVECSTSAGNVTIDVRSVWSPIGSAQFLKLVKLDLFTDLPFTRVCPKYITQYGRKYRTPNTPDPLHKGGVQIIEDDPNLWGKRDMDFGYVFFAGSGRNSRYDEMVVALCDMKGCRSSGLGKADWETPVGTIRKDGFEVLRQIEGTGKPYPRLEMAGQHPKAGGPNAAKMMQDPAYLKREYPNLAYWRGCSIVASDTHISRPLTVDHPDSVQIHAAGKSKAKPKPKAGASSSTDGSSSRSSGDGSSNMRGASSQPFLVEFTIATTNNPAGKVVLEIKPEWAPIGAQRFRDLTQSGFFDEARFFRTIKGFMAQFGIGSTPEKHKKWQKKVIKDDPVKVSNTRGTITFATSGPNSRTTQRSEERL